jgi:hypothetical protein
MAEVADVQPVTQIVKDHASLAAEYADRLGLPDRLHLAEPQLPAPVAGRRLEAEFLRRRAGREEDDIPVRRPDSGLER